MNTQRDGRTLRLVDGHVPVVDLTEARLGDGVEERRLAATVDAVCRDSGFLVIAGHGVDRGCVDRVHEASRRFFHQSLTDKRHCAARPGDPLMRGFGHRGNLAAGDGSGSVDLPDLSETFTINRLGDPEPTGLPTDPVAGLDAPNHWPDIPGFVASYRDYYARMETLAAFLMRVFAIALDLPPTWFDGAVDAHMSNLTANYYPPQPVAARAGQLRKGEHSDWGALTILYQDSGVGGLQVRGRDGEWLDVPAIPGTFVVNIGDLMARWTNDRWVSTVHRVVNPPRSAADTERFSIPFFFQPRFDTLVDCIPTCRGGRARYAPTRSGDHLLARLNAAYSLDTVAAS